MLGRMRHRGRTRDELWCEGPVALGVCASADARGPAIVRAGLEDDATVAVAFAGRLDGALSPAGDAELALRAYLRWGETFLTALVGEFTLVVWDGRRGRMLAARDAMGVRTLYHTVSARTLGIASEARALLALDGPFTLDEERIADYLVPPLEGGDRTSTFYREIVRLPGGHRLRSSASGIAVERYWSPADAPACTLGADEAVLAFRETFAEAVRCRIDGSGGAGVMLSGGVDSTAVAGFGARLRLERGGAALPTFSAVLRDASCPESRAIEALLAKPGLAPERIDLGDLAELDALVGALLDRVDEPFDATMVVPMLVYALASRAGLSGVLDGVDGDAIASLEPDFLGLLLRGGELGKAWRGAGALASFYEGSYAPWSSRRRLLAQAARSAWIPGTARRVARRALEPRRLARALAGSIVAPELVRRAHVEERLAALWEAGQAHAPTNVREYHVSQIDHPFLAVAVERYDRVAALASVEARHPFLDRRVVELAVALPWSVKVRDGWTKWVVREACRGLVPDEVRWRRGRWQRLGPRFLAALVRQRGEAAERSLDEGGERLRPYVDREKLGAARRRFRASSDPAHAEQVWMAAQLASWLARQAELIAEEERGMSEGKKKPYQAPKLTEYGALKDLTAGGSGNANESSTGQRPRP
jgi:asparagine synthase (glutamine-hydrolysing)